MDQFDLDVKDCCSSVARSKHLRLEEMGRLKAMSSFWVKHGAGMGWGCPFLKMTSNPFISVSKL